MTNCDGCKNTKGDQPKGQEEVQLNTKPNTPQEPSSTPITEEMIARARHRKLSKSIGRDFLTMKLENLKNNIAGVDINEKKYSR